MDMDTLMAGIGFPPEEAGLVREFPLSQAEWQTWKERYEQDRAGFYEALEAAPDTEMRAMALYVRLAAEALPRFLDRGADEAIYLDTFRDLTLWCGFFHSTEGRCGLREYRWLSHAVDATLFRLGRLEFEASRTLEDIRLNGAVLPAGTPVVDVHIPEGPGLTRGDVLNSFHRAKDFFGPELRYFACFSWMLSPALDLVLDPGQSSILWFRSLFHVYGADYHFPDMERRLYGNIRPDKEVYPEDTSLQRRAKPYIMQGMNFGMGKGILPVDELTNIQDTNSAGSFY